MKKMIHKAALLSAVVLVGCSSQSAKFPEPKTMAPMVEFWEKVYSQWNENQAVYHDNRYLDVVYEVVDVPSTQRRTYLNNHEELLRQRLTDMVERYETQRPLDSVQKKWLAMLKKSGGEAAIWNAPERLRYQTGLKNNFRRGLEISGQYVPEFKTIMKLYDVPEEIAYLPHVESSFQGSARSHVGAAGMWQFMPSTARAYLPMKRNVIDGRLDPYMAAAGAAQYLNDANQRVEAWPLALTGYNHGVGGMVRAKSAHGADIGKIVWEYQGDRFGFASRNFYAEFVAAKRIANNSRQYFPQLNPLKPRKVDAILLYEPMKVRDLANILEVPEIQLIEMNPAWLRNIQINKVGIPENIVIWIPEGYSRKISPEIGKEYEKR